MLKLAGAAYLVYVGVTTLWRTRPTPRPGRDPAQPPEPTSLAGSYRQGLLSNLLNPKVGVFYTTLLPQFVEPGQSVLVWTSVLAGLHLVIGVLWLVFYAWLVARLRAVVVRPRVRRALDRVTGVVLVGFGLRVAREAR